MSDHESPRRLSRPGRVCRNAVPLFFACLSLLVPAITEGADDDDQTPRRDFSTPQLTSKWRVVAGGNLTTYDTGAAWSPEGLAGAAIDLEDVLGLDERTNTYTLGVSYRINRRHSLGLAATDLRRTASRTLEGEIEWGDYVYRADATVRTELTTRVYKLTYRYDFSDMDRLNAGFAVGLSTFDLGLTLSGEARLQSDAGDEWIEGTVEGASAIAPVPVFGFYLDYALSPRWVLRFQADLIELSVGDFEGRVVEGDFAFEYGFTDLFAAGLALGGTDLEYHSDEDGERFGIRYRFSYLGAYAAFTF